MCVCCLSVVVCCGCEYCSWQPTHPNVHVGGCCTERLPELLQSHRIQLITSDVITARCIQHETNRCTTTGIWSLLFDIVPFVAVKEELGSVVTEQTARWTWVQLLLLPTFHVPYRGKAFIIPLAWAPIWAHMPSPRVLLAKARDLNLPKSAWFPAETHQISDYYMSKIVWV